MDGEINKNKQTDGEESKDMEFLEVKKWYFQGMR